MANGRCGKCDGPLDGTNRSWCKRCLAAYQRDRWAGNPDGMRAYQREWQRANKHRVKGYKRRYTLKLYGLTEQEYMELLLAQGNCCAVCKQTPEEVGADTRSFYIDHDHTTGQVRGLLCSKCNFGIGQFDDDVERIRAAITYLERARARHEKEGM